MKIRVYGKDYAEHIRKFDSFIIDTEKYPELEPEVSSIVQAHNDGTKPKDMDHLMESLITKMWETNVKIDNSFAMNLAECFEPFENVSWEKLKNEESWLEFEGVVGDNNGELAQPRWLTDDTISNED
jgi:glucan phosphorylase